MERNNKMTTNLKAPEGTCQHVTTVTPSSSSSRRLVSRQVPHANAARTHSQRCPNPKALETVGVAWLCVSVVCDLCLTDKQDPKLNPISACWEMCVCPAPEVYRGQSSEQCCNNFSTGQPVWEQSEIWHTGSKCEFINSKHYCDQQKEHRLLMLLPSRVYFRDGEINKHSQNVPPVPKARD